MRTRSLYFPIAAIYLAACFQAQPLLCRASGNNVAIAPKFETDLTVLNTLWSQDSPVTSVEDFFRVTVHVGPQVVVASTHLFGPKGTVNAIPYHDLDASGTLSPSGLSATHPYLANAPLPKDSSGNLIARGDSEIARYFAPGEIGYAVKNHRHSTRDLDLNSAAGDSYGLKEHIKLQDTHIELLVGVMRDGEPGVVTLNNPQGYPGDYIPGRFGGEHYPMIFLRPEFPSYLTPEVKNALVANIRTMMVGFNAISKFPGDYNGGDPLAARNPEKVREHVKNMILAIAGEGAEKTAATAYWNSSENMIYCAELGHVSTSAGLIVPLNRTHLSALGLSDAVIERFAQYVATAPDSPERTATPFAKLNRNFMIRYVDLAMAPESLQPAASYAPANLLKSESDKLAFGPMTMADIIESFLETHLPRRALGEALAPAQGEVLKAMKPGLIESMGLNQPGVPADLAAQVDQLFAAIVTVVSTPYENYEVFRNELSPLLEQARQMTGPRGDSGAGLYVPPSLFHIIALDTENPPAQGAWQDRGLLALRYIGHGIPFSAMRAIPGAPAPVVQ